jgi:hypothetical protein
LFIKSEKFMNIPSSHIQPAIPPMESYSPWLSVTSPPRSVGSPAWRCSPRCGAPAGGGSDSRGSAARSKSRELCPNLLGGRWRSEKWHLFGVYHDIIWYIYIIIYICIYVYICVYIYMYIYMYTWDFGRRSAGFLFQLSKHVLVYNNQSMVRFHPRGTYENRWGSPSFLITKKQQ